MSHSLVATQLDHGSALWGVAQEVSRIRRAPRPPLRDLTRHLEQEGVSIPARHVAEYERRWIEGLNCGDVAVADDMFAPDCAIHITGSLEPIRGPAEIKQTVTGLQGAFPDLRFATVRDESGRNTEHRATVDRLVDPESLRLCVLELDVTGEVSVQRAAYEVLQEAGRLDVLVNNRPVAGRTRSLRSGRNVA